MRQSHSPTTTALTNANMVQSQDNGVGSNLDKYVVKSGKLVLLHRVGQHTTQLPVFVRVYRNAFEHFAVVTRDQAISIHSTYVNLRMSTCAVSEGNATKIEVVQNNYEGTVITFDCGDKDTVSEWVEAFTCATPPCSPTQGGMSAALSPVIPRSPMMPTLPEVDEEE